MFIAPLSELYGRLVIYHICNIIYIGFIIGCALARNTGQFLAFRFLAGCAASGPLTVGGGTVADVVPPAQRGKVMSLFFLGPLLGPVSPHPQQTKLTTKVIGPIIGGFVSESIGWRWTFWIITILVSPPSPKDQTNITGRRNFHRLNLPPPRNQRRCPPSMESCSTKQARQTDGLKDGSRLDTTPALPPCHRPTNKDPPPITNRPPPLPPLCIPLRTHLHPLHHLPHSIRTTIPLLSRHFWLIISRPWNWNGRRSGNLRQLK